MISLGIICVFFVWSIIIFLAADLAYYSSPSQPMLSYGYVDFSFFCLAMSTIWIGTGASIVT